jgi:hypothetical protein
MIANSIRETCSFGSLDLPHGHDRELVHDRDRDYTLNGSESQTLATVGAFRMVSERDLRDPSDSAGHLRHFEQQGLIQRVPLSERERAVTLTQASITAAPTEPRPRDLGSRFTQVAGHAAVRRSIRARPRSISDGSATARRPMGHPSADRRWANS